MFKHNFRGFLFAPDPAAAGGGGDPAPKIDMGAPFELGDAGDKPKEAAKPAEKSDVEKQLDALRADFGKLEKRNQELSESEKYWANKARGAAAPPPELEPEVEDEVLPAASPFEGEKPEKFLDDLSVKGLQGLLDRGVITQAQFVAEVGKIEQRLTRMVDTKLATQNRHLAIDAELAKFPELKKADSPLFKRTQEHWKQMVADDPSIKDSPAPLLAAARRAEKELELEAKAAGNDDEARRTARRERIANQMGDREAPGEEDTGGDHLSSTARTIVNNLSRFGATEDGFRQFAGGKNGRGK